MDADVLIAGAGPAGASAAIRLSQLGHRVLLLDRGEQKRQHVGESLPSSIRVVLSTLGIELPSELVVRRPPAHLVYWGEMQGGRSWADVPERESSLLVWRGPFDRFLRRSGDRSRSAAPGRWRLSRDAARRPRRPRRKGSKSEPSRGADLRGRFFIDATGRAGRPRAILSPERAPLPHVRAHRTFRYRRERAADVVEAFEDGWIWTAPLANGLRDVTVMLDAPEERADRSALFASALERAPHISSLVSGTSLQGPLRGIDATPYDSRRFARRRLSTRGRCRVVSRSALRPRSPQGDGRSDSGRRRGSHHSRAARARVRRGRVLRSPRKRDLSRHDRPVAGLVPAGEPLPCAAVLESAFGNERCRR